MLQLRFFFAALFLLGLFSCGNFKTNRLDIPASRLPEYSVQLKAYGIALFQADTGRLADELMRLQIEFDYFLGDQPINEEQVNQIRRFVRDPYLQNLYAKTRQTFPETEALQKELEMASRHYLYYFPNRQLPDIYTYISGVYYESPVLSDQNAFVIGLDCYLGEEEPTYAQTGIPKYRTARMSSEYIVRDVFDALYRQQISRAGTPLTLLEEMIENGKRLYFLQAMLPKKSDEILIGYRIEQYEWAKEHHGEVWAFLVSEQLLFKNDFMMFKKLFGDGPFTQEFSEAAPARLGEFIGWQMVQKYMDNFPKTSLPELIKMTDYQELMTKSKYKPKA